MLRLDASQLIQAKRDVAVPFNLRVDREGAGFVDITCITILRLLPAKRIVALAEFAGQQVLIKLFLGRNAGRYVHRERTGVAAIADAGVSTPALLWEAGVENGHLLVFEYLPNAISLAQKWANSEESTNRQAILGKVMRVIASLHNHGVAQQDIHLGNFLITEDRIFTIDGGAVERKGDRVLSEVASLRNLASFFAQFYPGFDALIDEVFPAYEQYRGWSNDSARLARLRQEVMQSREIRKRNYIGKTFRDCTRFLCKETFNRFEVCERSAYTAELADLMKQPDRFIERGKVLKDGNSATVALVHLPDRSLVVKRYNMKNPWHGLRRAFRNSRAWHSWGNAHRMEFLGIPSLKPIALIENRLGPIRVSAYLITEYIEGPDALECLRDMDNPNGELELLADILHKLSEVRISHGDLKATNFVMAEAGPVLIDLDGMKEHRSQQSFEQAFGRDLRRFMENWRDYPLLQTRFSGLLQDMCTNYGVKL